jgi:hypothetical protein
MSEWLRRIVPRNQDDAYPLFLICKDVLKKFHLRELRYIAKVSLCFLHSYMCASNIELHVSSLQTNNLDMCLAKKANQLLICLRLPSYLKSFRHQTCTTPVNVLVYNYLIKITGVTWVQYEQSLLDIIDAKDAEMRDIQERCDVREQKLDQDSLRMVSSCHALYQYLFMDSHATRHNGAVETRLVCGALTHASKWP